MSETKKGNEQRPAYRVCTRCYRRYSTEDSPCPACWNPEFGLPGGECDSFAEFKYTWRFKSRLPERYGTRCRVVKRSNGPGPRNILVEFEDGYRVVTTWRAVKKNEQFLGKFCAMLGNVADFVKRHPHDLSKENIEIIRKPAGVEQ